MNVQTHMDYTNNKSFMDGSLLVTQNGGMLLPTRWDDEKGVIMKNRGDVYLQFYCHIKSKYGLDEIRNNGCDYTEFIDRDKKLIYRVSIFELTLFLNSILVDSTITISTGKGYVQWYRKPIEEKVNQWIEKNIIKS